MQYIREKGEEYSLRLVDFLEIFLIPAGSIYLIICIYVINNCPVGIWNLLAVIITSTLKKEEYTAHKYDQYEGNANVIDYSNNESSKLLQTRYVPRLKEIVESFRVIFE